MRRTETESSVSPIEDRVRNWTTLFARNLVPLFPSAAGTPKSDVVSVTSADQISDVSKQILNDLEANKQFKLDSLYAYPSVQTAPHYLAAIVSATSHLIGSDGHVHWNIALASAVARRVYFGLLEWDDESALAFVQDHMCKGAFWKQPLVLLKGTELLEIFDAYEINSAHYMEVWSAIREAPRRSFKSVFPINGFQEWEQFRNEASERSRIIAMGWLGFVNTHYAHPRVVADFYHYWALDREIDEPSRDAFVSYIRSRAVFTPTNRLRSGPSS